jgi:hypothetical protein
MEIKTKFNVDDTVFFLTTTDRIMNFGELADNKPYVCEGIVDSFDITYKHEKLVITYAVKVRESRGSGEDGLHWMYVEEDWCAPDIIQLGQNVSNRFRVNFINPLKAKKKK